MINFFRWYQADVSAQSPSLQASVWKKVPFSPKAWASKDIGSSCSLSSTLKIWGIRKSTLAKWLWDDFGGEIVVTPEWARICHEHCEDRHIRYLSYQLMFDKKSRHGDSGFLASWKSFHPVACVTGSVGRCFRMGTCCLSDGVSYASDHQGNRWNAVYIYIYIYIFFFFLHPQNEHGYGKPTMNEDVFPIEHGIFQCHISFQGCILSWKKLGAKNRVEASWFWGQKGSPSAANTSYLWSSWTTS